MNKDKTNIGIKQNGLKEKEKPVDRDAAISRLATIETTKISMDAIVKDIKH